MKIFSENLRKGIKLYRGKYSLLLNALWWGVAPVGVILIVGGVVCKTSTPTIIGACLIFVGGFVYAIFADKNEKSERAKHQEKPS